jgi:DNA topoisomerase III
MVAQLVSEVKRETKKMIVIEQDVVVGEKKAGKEAKTTSAAPKKAEKEVRPTSTGTKKTAVKKAAEKPDEQVPTICPKCKKGTMLKGKTAFGCSEYKNGCTFKVMFEQ